MNTNRMISILFIFAVTLNVISCSKNIDLNTANNILDKHLSEELYVVDIGLDYGYFGWGSNPTPSFYFANGDKRDEEILTKLASKKLIGEPVKSELKIGRKSSRLIFSESASPYIAREYVVEIGRNRAVNADIIIGIRKLIQINNLATPVKNGSVHTCQAEFTYSYCELTPFADIYLTTEELNNQYTGKVVFVFTKGKWRISEITYKERKHGYIREFINL